MYTLEQCGCVMVTIEAALWVHCSTSERHERRMCPIRFSGNALNAFQQLNWCEYVLWIHQTFYVPVAGMFLMLSLMQIKSVHSNVPYNQRWDTETCSKCCWLRIFLFSHPAHVRMDTFRMANVSRWWSDWKLTSTSRASHSLCQINYTNSVNSSA